MDVFIQYLGQSPCYVSTGMRWVPSDWKLEPVNTNIERSKLFQEILLDKIKGHTNTNKPHGKRLNLRATVISQVSFLKKKFENRRKEQHNRNLNPHLKS